jgi:intraflagellar transport protein 56
MNRPGTSLSKGKGKGATTGAGGMPIKPVENKILQAPDYIKNRDWVGAITLLELEKSVTDTRQDTLLWLAYCNFHHGDYRKSIMLYDDLMRKGDYNKELHVYKACCLYALCNYDEAKRECLKGIETPLYVRLMFHISHKKNDESSLMTYHHKIQETTHDQLCLAAIHYLRGHFEEATDIYKKLLLENREYLAINVYVALCYYKMDYYDVSLEILSAYLAQNPTSIIAVNLKACNQYQIYNGKQAEAELKTLENYYKSGKLFEDYDLLRHNLVVFRNGENALQHLPPLVEYFPEAKLNLVIYYLKNDEVNEALNLIKDLEPSTPREYILKGVVHAVIGQQQDSREHLKQAQQLFQLVGASPSECDTIPGRQCMASCFYLLKQFDDVLVYLKSIRNFFQNDDDFNWNYAIASAAAGDYKEAEEGFQLVQNEKYKMEYCYATWLARTFIMNGKPNLAWEIYINMETSTESFTLLQLIANDSYKMGHFYYSVKAFDILERLDSDIEYSEAKRGATVGVFQMVVAGKESKDHLAEVLGMLKNSGNNPQVEYIFKVIKKWGKDNGLKI